MMAEKTRKRKEDPALEVVEEGQHQHLGAIGETHFRLYRERWVQLVLLSLLALISDWVCFATAAVPREFYEATGGHRSAALINSFFVANVASCFLYTDLSRRFGPRTSTAFAGLAMFAGCVLRSGVPGVGGLPPYVLVVLGTTLVGMAQPFFQCAPPLLSSTWFSKRERSLATATALNANQLGIAAAFVVGGSFVGGRAQRLKPYLDLITLVAGAAATATWCLFKDRPPTPPTASAAQREAEAREPMTPLSDSGIQPRSVSRRELATCLDDLGLTFHRSLYALLFRTKGFSAPLAAFVASIAVTNVLSAFAGDYLDRAGARVSLATVGATFQVAIVLGGVVLGSVVDSTHAYKATTLACLGVAVFLLLVLGVACGYDAQLPAGVVVSVILALGAAVGPVQPINAELAVEVTHPFDENAVEAAQQLAGNLVSALLVPLYQAAAVFDLQLVPVADITQVSLERNKNAPPYDSPAYSRGAIKKQIYGFHDRASNPQDPSEVIHPFIRDLLIPEPPFLSPRPRDARGDSILLVILVAATLSFFASFKFDLKRLRVDESSR
ncbi:hypothetical protein CTAYLR_007859 [Chrysophaeum taylorii]|uniref:Uncharacterized protein n=1 Tax=Chrysophaeum taylorii TaxID=2483200 RepID=A0AAD7UEE6_9STRA|nr:hypothetical protein CTAYLR_007859 [Chrysophaeum taylorii]